MKYPLLLIAILLLAINSFSQNAGAVFTTHSDVGVNKIPGNITYNSEMQQYTITGSGQNMWFAHDDFHFAWKKLRGDFILDAQFHFNGKGSNGHRKTGWMVRHSLEPNTPYTDVAVHGDGLTSLQFPAVPSTRLPKK